MNTPPALFSKITLETPLLVATGNQHKMIEFRRLLPHWSLHSLAEYPQCSSPVEDASTFIGNALIKARQAWKHTGILSLADDSGLEVEALGGAPGIYSARYVEGSDRDRTLAVLEAMKTKTNRNAQFRCALVLVGFDLSFLNQFQDRSMEKESLLDELDEGVFRYQDALVSIGRVKGQLTTEIQGQNGFGYDPIFKVNAAQTIAEISDIQKDLISHRGVACKKMNDLLKKNLTFPS